MTSHKFKLALAHVWVPRLLKTTSFELFEVIVCDGIVYQIVKTITIPLISQFVLALLSIFPSAVSPTFATTLESSRLKPWVQKNEFHMAGNSHTLSNNECNDGDVSDGTHVHW